MTDIFAKGRALAATAQPAVFSESQLMEFSENMRFIKQKWDARDREAWRAVKDFVITD